MKNTTKEKNDLKAFLIVQGKKSFVEKYGADVFEKLWLEIVDLALRIDDPDQKLTYLEMWGIPYKLSGADCSTDWA
tara:strand:+ start:2223 stop:2450 length:228 start_codon:yes stop_codon:yes gene_type:complete